jgi:hypothetical protein
MNNISMDILKKQVFVLLIMVFTLAVPLAYGETTPADQPAKSRWEFVIAPYLWMPGLSGDVTVRGIPAHVTIPFSDILKDLNFTGQVHLEAWKDRWGLFLDITYMDLSTNAQGVLPRRGPASGDMGMQEWIAEFGGLYRFATWPLGKDGKTALTLEGLVGGRYWNLLATLDLSIPQTGVFVDTSGRKEWVDPFVGARMRLDLNDKFSLSLRGDVGGFDVGSKFTYNAVGLVGYNISRVVSLWLGYRVMGVNYETGSGLNKFQYDVTMYGPITGIVFRF